MRKRLEINADRLIFHSMTNSGNQFFFPRNLEVLPGAALLCLLLP